MLVLSRKAGQAIVLPELGIRIVVVEIRGGNAVKIGIDADRRHTILREELSDQKTTPPEQGSVVHVGPEDTSASSVS